MRLAFGRRQTGFRLINLAFLGANGLFYVWDKRMEGLQLFGFRFPHSGGRGFFSWDDGMCRYFSQLFFSSCFLFLHGLLGTGGIVLGGKACFLFSFAFCLRQRWFWYPGRMEAAGSLWFSAFSFSLLLRLESGGWTCLDTSIELVVEFSLAWVRGVRYREVVD